MSSNFRSGLQRPLLFLLLHFPVKKVSFPREEGRAFPPAIIWRLLLPVSHTAEGRRPWKQVLGKNLFFKNSRPKKRKSTNPCQFKQRESIFPDFFLLSVWGSLGLLLLFLWPSLFPLPFPGSPPLRRRKKGLEGIIGRFLPSSFTASQKEKVLDYCPPTRTF